MKNILQICICCITALLPISGCSAAPAAAPSPQKVLWYDGVSAAVPQGALLTNNPGFFGKMIRTNVTYRYETPPTNPSDIQGRDTSQFGNRLLDGQPVGDWHSPVGINNKPLVIEFDFHQTATINEITVSQFRGADLRLAQVEVKSDETAPWTKVLSRHDSKGSLHHLVLPEPAKAQLVRLTVQSTSDITYISQVWMWGDAQSISAKPLNGVLPQMTKFPETKNAMPGDATILSRQVLEDWRKTTGYSQDGLTWQIAPTWQMLEKHPLKSTFLPGKEELQQPVSMSTTQTEGESAAVFLINASDQARDVTVRLDQFTGKSTFEGKSTLYAAGAIWTRRQGQTLRPLFNAENKLGSELMQKYLTNGSIIKDFPTLHLPPRGTALLWITVQTDNAESDEYEAILHADEIAIPVHLKVLSATLPQPDSWVRLWGDAPAVTRNLWSNETAIKNEIAYQQSMGASVWRGWPEEGSYQQLARQIANQHGRKAHFVSGISAQIRGAGYTGKLDPATFDADFKNQITAEIQQMEQTAQRLGLSYQDWSVELWDEPRPQNMPAWAAIARLIKAHNPRVQIYMNPLFWTREGTNPGKFADDANQVLALDGWYNQSVDISVPIFGQVNATEYPEANQLFYNHLPRAVRAYFTHPNPGRKLTWEAFGRNFNGWGFYAYFAPRNDAWNDFDGTSFDYQIVYPGPNGFIPTIESESMRESWEDYQLLTLLEKQGKANAVREIMDDYNGGKSTFTALRERILRYVVGDVSR